MKKQKNYVHIETKIEPSAESYRSGIVYLLSFLNDKECLERTMNYVLYEINERQDERR